MDGLLLGLLEEPGVVWLMLDGLLEDPLAE